jgi:hypothetical protein
MMKKQILVGLFSFLLTTWGFSQSDVSLTYTSFLGGSGFDIPEQLDFNSDSTAFYLCGGTTSEDAPITGNATYPELGGFKNVYIAKMGLNGELQFATYLGGEGIHNVYGMTVDNNDRFIVCGSSLSPDFPLINADSEDFHPPSIGFLTCFDASYEIVWSTFVGGLGTDIIYDVKTDSSGNVFITGITTSSGLGSPEVFQQELPYEDFSSGFVAKYSPDGNRVWYTYFGDDGFTGSRSLDISADGDVVYILGTSTGSTFPFEGHQTENNGEGDLFVAAISAPDGNVLWGSYFGGENDEFQGEIIALTGGSVAISGTTSSESNIATPGAHQAEFGGSFGDNLLALFDHNGLLEWATYLGGEGFEGGVSNSLFTSHGMLYLSSKSGSMSEIGLGNQQIEFAPNDPTRTDYLAVFDLDGSLNWCSALNPNFSCTSNSDFIISGDGRIYSVGVYENMFDQSESEECLSVISPDADQPEFGGGSEDIGIFIYQYNTLSTSFPQVEPLTIYPNPTQNFVTIEAPNLLWAGMDLTVTDISGRQVDRIARFQSGNTYSTGQLSEGVYILAGQIGERMFRQKLVVQR